MPEPSIPRDEKPVKAIRVKIAMDAAVVLAVCSSLTIGVWLGIVDPIQRHAAFCALTRAELESLAKKRPSELSRKQWAKIVGWTLTAHANMVEFKQNIPQVEQDAFVAELGRRLAGPVDLSTIDWIWDETVRLTGYQSYADRFRPTSPQSLREFERIDAPKLPIEVD